MAGTRLNLLVELIFHFWKQSFERTLVPARRTGPAEVLAHHDKLRVVILPVVQSSRPALLIQCRFAKRFQPMVTIPRLLLSAFCCLPAGFRLAPSVSLKYSFRVGVDDKTVVSACIEQHAVRCLGANAVDSQQTLANRRSFPGKELAQIAVKVLHQHAQK